MWLGLAVFHVYNSVVFRYFVRFVSLRFAKYGIYFNSMVQIIDNIEVVYENINFDLISLKKNGSVLELVVRIQRCSDSYITEEISLH